MRILKIALSLYDPCLGGAIKSHDYLRYSTRSLERVRPSGAKDVLLSDRRPTFRKTLPRRCPRVDAQAAVTALLRLDK